MNDSFCSLNIMKKTNAYKILFLTLFWECCFLFLIFFEGVVTDYKFIASEAIPFGSLTLFPAIIISTIGASFTAAFEVLFFSKIFRKTAFGKTLLYKTSFYLFNMIVWFSLVLLISKSFELGRPIHDKAVIEHYMGFLFSDRNLVSIIYWGFVTFLGLSIIQVSDKFGQGILMNFLIGKYHQPKTENRIFLFMDLRASTATAEKLGHIKYSQLIQDCFYDLTDIVLKYHAQIYQYVGDEVVLTWDYDTGLKDNNCVHIFFAFDKLLTNKNEYYSKKFGTMPEFRAGVHFGEVTVAEVGEIKKELAYHGDVLNTTARIQSKCSVFQERFLISETMKNNVRQPSDFIFEFKDDVRLRGKRKPVKIYSVNPS